MIENGCLVPLRRRYLKLLKVLRVLDLTGSMSPEEWEVAGVYRVFVFRKRAKALTDADRPEPKSVAPAPHWDHLTPLPSLHQEDASKFDVTWPAEGAPLHRVKYRTAFRPEHIYDVVDAVTRAENSSAFVHPATVSSLSQDRAAAVHDLVNPPPLVDLVPPPAAPKISEEMLQVWREKQASSSPSAVVKDTSTRDAEHGGMDASTTSLPAPTTSTASPPYSSSAAPEAPSDDYGTSFT